MTHRSWQNRQCRQLKLYILNPDQGQNEATKLRPITYGVLTERIGCNGRTAERTEQGASRKKKKSSKACRSFFAFSELALVNFGVRCIFLRKVGTAPTAAGWRNSMNHWYGRYFISFQNYEPQIRGRTSSPLKGVYVYGIDRMTTLMRFQEPWLQYRDRIKEVHTMYNNYSEFGIFVSLFKPWHGLSLSISLLARVSCERDYT